MFLISDPDLLRGWTIGLVVAVLVVLIVVVLLAAILLAARRILAAAVRCLHAVEAIRANTQPLHDLTTTNAVAAELLGGAVAIKTHAEIIASALEATEHPAPAHHREAHHNE